MLRILLDWQYEIFEADDGSTAIEEAGKRHFDLIRFYCLLLLTRCYENESTVTFQIDVYL